MVLRSVSRLCFHGDFLVGYFNMEKIMDQNDNQNMNTQPYFCKVIGKTTYVVRVYFSESAKETLEEKIKKMIPKDIVVFSSI